MSYWTAFRDWFYRGVTQDGGVLSIDPAYFSITGGRERWLYRVARKHAGGNGANGFGITMPVLFDKSGAEGTYRRFKVSNLKSCASSSAMIFRAFRLLYLQSPTASRSSTW